MRMPNFIRLLCVAASLAVAPSLTAQVSGVSYTLSPGANYTFWDEQAGIGDGLLAGGHLGIGFGENVELRGLYLLGVGLKRDFDGVLDQNISNLADRDVSLNRYGGEIKLNLGRSRLLPFLTLGAGVQSIELDGLGKNEHVYASGGLGITLSIADRFTFKLEGKNTSYNFNPVRNLLTAGERTTAGLDGDDFFNARISNWSLGTGFTVYLGGRRPGTLTEVDRAYAEALTGGFANVSLLVEPTLARINFDDALPYKDMYLGGAGLGLDFGPLVGFRAYYLKGMEDDEITLDFDDIAVYGADFRFRFSSATSGLSPFVSLGGGYIDTQDEYRGNNNTSGAASQAFASGGLGASLNLSRSFRLTGNYKVLLTTSEDAEDLNNTDQIVTSNQWSVGVNLAFGKKARRPDAMFTSTAQAEMQRAQAEATLEKQVALADQAKRNAEATKQLRNDYEVKIYSLNEELAKAQTMRDTVMIDSLEAAIQQTQDVVNELDSREKDLEKTITEVETETNFLQEQLDEQVNAPVPNTPAVPSTFGTPQNNGGFFSGTNADGTPAPPVSRLSFTPAEFEGLIEEIFEGLNYGMPPMGMMPAGEYEVEYGVTTTAPGMSRAADTTRVYELEQQVKELSTALRDLNEEQNTAIKELREQQLSDKEARKADKEELREEMKQSTQSILEELRSMRNELGNKSNMTDKEREQMKKDAEKAAKEAKEAAEKAKKEAEKAAKKAAKKNGGR